MCRLLPAAALAIVELMEPAANAAFRLLLLPLKLPKGHGFYFNNASKSPKGTASSGPLPYPFLYVHLARTETSSSPTPLGLPRRSRLSRFLSWSEAKWQTYSEAPARSIKGLMFQLGSKLLDRIPPGEKQLWRLHALQDHLGHVSLGSPKGPHALRLETSHAFYDHQTKLTHDLSIHLSQSAARHRRWAFVTAFFILPSIFLSLMPFGKLVLAWVVFRAISHYRAYQGASFLLNCLKSRLASSDFHYTIKFVVTPEIDKHLPVVDAGTVSQVAIDLARDLQSPELVNVLPRAFNVLCDLERRTQASNLSSGYRRRAFSNENLLDP